MGNILPDQCAVNLGIPLLSRKAMDMVVRMQRGLTSHACRNGSGTFRSPVIGTRIVEG